VRALDTVSVDGLNWYNGENDVVIPVAVKRKKKGFSKKR